MATNPAGGGAASRLRVEGSALATRLWPWLPLPLAVVYLVILAAKLNQLIATTYANADFASAPVIGQLFGGSPAHRDVFLGQVGWFSTLIFELATRWLPLHRDIWEVAPYAMAFASVAAISWGAWKVGGRWAATITGVLLLCAGPQTLELLSALDDHTSTWFSLALLAALLMALETRLAWQRRWLTALLVVVVGAIVGANAASDLLLLAAGIAPIVLAAAATWVLRPGPTSARAWWWVIATMAVAGVGDGLTRWWARHETVLTPPGLVHTQFASSSVLGGNFDLWWQSVMLLGNGNFFGQRLGFTSTIEVTCAVLVVVAVVLIPRMAWREIARVLPSPHADAQSQAPLVAWCVFWAASGLLLSASFVLSSNPMDLSSSRYLVGVLYAAAALVPLAATRRAGLRALVVAGTTVFAFTGVVTLAQTSGPSSTSVLYNQVAAIADAQHLEVGYADYWDAAPLTWASHVHLKVYPVQDCLPNSVPTLCWSALHMITSWYTPRPHVRSFLITDSAQVPSAAPPPSLGAPRHEYQLGVLTMYVYPYDIAAKMMP